MEPRPGRTAMTPTGRTGVVRLADRIDEVLMKAPGGIRGVVYALTVAVMVVTALPHVPRAYVDFSSLPVLGALPQPDTYGTDTIADMYVARVVLNDPADMYTKAKVAQTPLEAATWTKEASSPYPPAMLLAEAGLYALGEWTGIGFYGMVLMAAVFVVTSSAIYFLKTRWYLFPALYLNFSYFGERFVYVQDGSYLVMLSVILTALWLARAGRDASHALVALAIAMKLSPLYYLTNLPRMRRSVAVVFVGILAAGLVLPYFVLENYLYIFQYGAELKGDWDNLAASLIVVVPFALTVWYVETRLGFDREDRIGWGLVPFALLLALKMNVARHLVIVLLVPDKRGVRNIAAAAGLAVPALLPVPFNASLAVAAIVLVIGLASYLAEIGWDRVRADLTQPGRTLKEMAGVRRGR
jgi:hypothetical protein